MESPKEGSQRRVRRSLRRSKTCFAKGANLLGNQEIDDIYNFVRKMKETKLGESMLEEYAIKQACEADEDLSESLQQQDIYPLVPASIAVDPSNRSARRRVRTHARRAYPTMDTCV